MTTFKKYCHRFEEQRLGKEEKKQSKLGHEEVYDDMASFSGLQTAWKTEFEIHISNPQRWTSEFQDKKEENQYMASFSGLQTAWKTEFEIHISNPQRWTSEFQDKREENQY